MTKWTLRCLAVITVCLASAASASPRLLPADDEEDKPIRAAATEFYKALGSADPSSAAKLCFAGDHDRALLQAYIDFIIAFDDLQAALTERFGPDKDRPAISIREGMRQLAAASALKLIVLSGDTASLAAGSGPTDLGLLLRRDGGAWRVVRTAAQGGWGEANHKSLQECARQIAEVTVGIKAGKYPNRRAADDDMGKRTLDLLLVGTKSRPIFSVVLALPTSRPLSAERDLRAAMGKHLTSPEISALIAELPGVPACSLIGKRLFVSSEEAGISLSFGLPDAKLSGIMLYVVDRDGYRAYSGELPKGLVAADTRDIVERKLGRPCSSSGGYSAVYQGGIVVGYRRPDPRDPLNPLADVVLRMPRPNEVPVELPKARPYLAFRLVAARDDAAADEMTDPDNPAGAPLRVERRVLLDETAIAYVGSDKGKTGNPALSIELTPEGGREMERISSANPGRSLALVVDNRVISAPRMAGPMADRLVIDLGHRAVDVDRLAGRLHATIFALPATRPVEP